MNHKKWLRCMGLLAVAVLLFSGTPWMHEQVAAETRTLYVGDILQLSIEADLSEDALRQKFQDFEIVELTREASGYSLSVRTFTAGEKKILLGDKELVIQIGSTLKDIERSEPFEGDKGVMPVGFPFIWHILFAIAAGVFMLFGVWLFGKRFWKRKQREESPYSLFLRQCEAAASDEQYFVALTFYWKSYISTLCNIPIIGKTTDELMRELQAVERLASSLPSIYKWLAECDRLKFTGAAVSEEDRQKMYKDLLDITKHINEGAV